VTSSSPDVLARAEADAPVAGPASSAPPEPVPRRRRWRGLRVARWVSPLALLVIWQVLAGTGLVPASKLPSLNVVWQAAVQVAQDGQLGEGLAVSLRRMLIGFVIGALIGGILGVLAGLLRSADVTVDPLMQMLRNIPLFGTIPLLILWFGIGELPKIVLIAVAGAVPIYVNVYAGIREVDPRLVEATTALGYSRAQRLVHVVLPAAVPHTLVGVRLGVASSWLALVVAETVNADSGIGFMINNARDFLRTDIVIVGLLVYALVGLVLDSVLRGLERWLLRWRTA
jgi:sulfonate transport system permease protein